MAGPKREGRPLATAAHSDHPTASHSDPSQGSAIREAVDWIEAAEQLPTWHVAGELHGVEVPPNAVQDVFVLLDRWPRWLRLANGEQRVAPHEGEAA
jgi:hypothetical protein